MEESIHPTKIVAFCKESGIKRELIVPYNLEQTRVVEQKNRSIEESVNAILYDQDLPKFLWGEATNTIVYIFKIEVPIGHLMTELLRKYSLGRNQL